MNQKKMTWKRIIAILSAIVLLATTIPIENLRAETNDDVSLTLDVTEVSLDKGGEQQVTATVTPVEGVKLTESNVQWDLDDSSSSIVEVTDTGLITAKAKGEATVTATCFYEIETEDGESKSNYVQENVKVTVYEIPELTVSVGSDVKYPTTSVVTVTGVPEGVACTLYVNGSAVDKADLIVDEDNQIKYEKIFNAGTHTIYAKTEADEDNYYKNATSDEVTLSVAYGETGFKVAENTKTAYCGDKVEYTLSSGMDGKVTVTCGDQTSDITLEKKQEKVYTYECTEAGSKTLSFKFVADNDSDNNYYVAPIEKELEVKKIPVTIDWENSFKKTYDGTTTYETSTPPEVSVGVEGKEAPKLEEVEKYVFTTDSAEVGNTNATLNDALEIATNPEYYEIENTNPTVDIAITAKVLTEDNLDMTGFSVDGKGFDGTSKAYTTGTITLKANSLVEADEEKTCELNYEANYYKNNELTIGDSEKDTKNVNVVITNIKVVIEGEESANYTFGDLKKEMDGKYTIATNGDFFEFVGIEEKNIATEFGKRKQNYYLLKEDKQGMQIEGIQFGIIEEEEVEDGKYPETLTYSDALNMKKEDVCYYVYAKKVDASGNELISQRVRVKYDGTFAGGDIYAVIGEDKTPITVGELAETFNTIKNKTDITIVLMPTTNDVVKVEWFGSDDARTTTEWPTTDEELSNIEINEKEVTPNETTGEIDPIELEKITSEVKHFYYAKLTDDAGNESYVHTTGVLEDIYEPTVGITMEASDVEYGYVYDGETNKVNVTVDFAISEQGITSGIEEVEITLYKWNTGSEAVEDQDEYREEVVKYTVDAKDFWASSTALSAIRTLKKTDAPTQVQIDAASENIALSGAFKELADGKYKMAVVAKDKAGNSSKMETVEFIVDTQAPVVKVNTDFETDEDKNAENQYTGGKISITVSDLTLVDDEKTIAVLMKEGQEDAISIKWNTETKADGSITKTAVLELNETKDGQSEPNITYLKNGKYTLTFEVSDALETVKTFNGENEKLEFVYDDTAPLYTIKFDSPTTDIVDEDGKVYYNTTFEANIEVYEDTTYDDDRISIEIKSINGNTTVASWPTVVTEQSDEIPPIRVEHEEGSTNFKVVVEAQEDHSTDNEGYYVVISGYDVTGNNLEPKTETEGNAVNYATEAARYRELDTVKPDLTTVAYDTAPKFNTVNGTDYVNADTTVTFTLKENNPYQSVYTLTSETSEEPTVLKWTEKSTDTYTTTKLVKQRNETTGDEQTITLTILDKAGNKAVMSGEKRSADNTTFDETRGTFTDSFVVDTVAPIITYEYVDENPNSANVNGIDYFKKKAQVKVTVAEHNFDPSCAPVVVTKKNDTNVAYTETEWESNGDTHVKTFTFENDNEYVITIDATDCALNDFVLGDIDSKITVKEAEAGTTILNLAIDKTLSAIGDNKKPIVVINPVSNPGTTTDAQALYNTDVVYEVSVYDPKVNNYASGIDGITIKLESEDGTKATATVAKDGTITTDTGINLVLNEGTTGSLAQGEENRYVYYVTISKDTFNTNGIKLSASAADVSTNVTKATVDEIAIDTTAPVVVIDYSNDDVRNKKYFNKGRTATITVTERNFSDNCLNFYVNGKRINLKFTLKEAGTGNRDDATWVATYKINKDGDYVIKCNGKDRVGNTATVDYEGKATKKFTIDKTKPIITLTFNNNNAQNGSYYSSARTATITINEHNFRGSDIEITGTANNAGAAVSFPGISGWTSNGDVHTATITFTDDALYSLDVAYKDLALNKAKSPANQTFTIDNTDPVINFSDVIQGGAYPDKVVPKISFNDNNYLSHTVTLTRTNMDNKNEDVTSKFVKASGVNVDGTGKATGSNTIPDIAHEEENDGIYTITVTVNDKAGRSKTQSITYSINRFGSVYVYSDDLLDLLNGYTKLDDIAAKDLYIEAYNANTLVEDSVKLEITCDGSSLTDQLSTANVATDKLDSNGWNVYRFKLNNADFAKEGSYVITISDKDNAGNVQTNSDNVIEFYVDGTDPILESVIGLEESRYNASEQVVKYVASDAMGIAKIEIYIDGELVDTIEEFENAALYEGEFVIYESGERQDVRIVVTDKSGRTLDTSSETFINDKNRVYVFNSNVLVSTSLFDLWYDNKPLFWGSIAGVAALAFLIFFIILGKKKKEEEEEDEVA